jgi:hypothetical protein
MNGTDRGRILAVLQLPLAIVRTVDGVEHLYHFTKDVLVHGGKGTSPSGLTTGRPKYSSSLSAPRAASGRTSIA